VGFNRYFVPNLPSAGSIVLPSEEAHHALRVRREKVGNQCVAFDGLGNEALCDIVLIAKRDVTLNVVSFRVHPNELPGKVRLAVALPKGDRQKAVIERAVELGIHELVPIVCERSVCVPKDSSSEKWMRTVIEACKQCERNRLMTIAPPCDFETFLLADASNASETTAISRHFFAHPDRNSIDSQNLFSARAFEGRTAEEVFIAIGPEGGFSDSEVNRALAAGWEKLSLGSRILRVETAVCAASIFGSLLVQLPQDDQYDKLVLRPD